jgi:hypothetical protein
MSYRVLTGPAIPYVHALPSGLGFDGSVGETSSGSTWKDIILRLSEPFAQAGAQRLAYGKTDPYYSAYGYGSSPMYYGAQGAFGSGFGGLSPTTLLLGGAALLAVMMLGRK